MAERTKAKRQAAPAAEITTTTTRGGSKPGGSKGTATQARAAGSGTTKPAAKKASATKAAAKSTQARAAGSGSKSSAARSSGTAAKKATAAKPRQARSTAETDRIREALTARRDELREEYDVHLTEIAELQRDRLTDAAGDDQADTGSKTFEREQEISLAHSILERTTQVERALERLEEGNYGWCERCGNAIPVERLAAFPSATLCVSCKQLEERR
jgi:RNA polymerase-binding protein DksA